MAELRWADPAPVLRRARPLRGPAVLDQYWRDLTFLHWRVPPARVAPLFPPGTRPDLFDGTTWVGLIPFRLTRARLGPSPPLPYVGTFAETNVRFYSVDRAGRRGVVFGTLEAARLAFVLGARAALGLPYAWARMRIDSDGQTLTYRSRRRWPAPRGVTTRIWVRPRAEEVVDDPLSEFLTARWGLHTRHLGRTVFLPNAHPPWPLQRAELLELNDDLIASVGLPAVSSSPPDSVLFSSGVRTQFGLPWMPDSGGSH